MQADVTLALLVMVVGMVIPNEPLTILGGACIAA